MFSKVTFILVLASLSRAQENDPNQQAAPAKLREWGEQSGPFQLSIASDKEQYAAGETVRVTAVLKNVTEEPAWLVQQEPAIFYRMDIRVPIEAWIPLSPQAALTEFGQRQRHPLVGGSRGAADALVKISPTSAVGVLQKALDSPIRHVRILSAGYLIHALEVTE